MRKERGGKKGRWRDEDEDERQIVHQLRKQAREIGEALATSVHDLASFVPACLFTSLLALLACLSPPLLLSPVASAREAYRVMPSIG